MVISRSPGEKPAVSVMILWSLKLDKHLFVFSWQLFSPGGNFESVLKDLVASVLDRADSDWKFLYPKSASVQEGSIANDL